MIHKYMQVLLREFIGFIDNMWPINKMFEDIIGNVYRSKQVFNRQNVGRKII